jgi:acyl-CoA synthetase (AMP-forming)/AMP-acid ligase II
MRPAGNGTSLPPPPVDGHRLLRWLDSPRGDRGIRFAGPGERWEFHSYESLAAAARHQAWLLQDRGVRPGSVIALVHTTSPDYVGAFFGCLMLGATPAPIAPPTRFQGMAQYRQYLSRALRLSGASTVSTTSGLAGAVTQAADDNGAAIVIADEPRTAKAEWHGEPVPPVIGLLQLSSGTTGPSRGLLIPISSLEANIDTIVSWTNGQTADDAVASWAPLHHDMGLIGCLLAPVSRNVDAWLMQPDQFVRAPLRWLRCFGEHGATHTAVPNFGLGHVLRRVSRKSLEGSDFSGWRALIVGSERVDASTIEEFSTLLNPFGFSAKAILPAYGLAEATLAVTGARPDEDVTVVAVRRESMVSGREIQVYPGNARHETLAALRLVGCGRPLPGIDVDIIDRHGNPLGELLLGEVQVRGEGMARGYVGAEEKTEKLLRGVVRTGDAGFFLNGELFVVGRIGDSIKVRGRWLFAEEVDEIVSTFTAAKDYCSAILGAFGGTEAIIVLAEGGTVESVSALGTVMANHISGVRILVLGVSRGSILRTTSGKPRRRAMRDRLLAGELPAVAAWDSDPQSRGFGESANDGVRYQ